MSTANKLTYLNETKGKLKDTINYTGAGIDGNTTFRNYDKKLYDGLLSSLVDSSTLYGNLPKVGEQTGTSVQLNGTGIAPMRLSPASSELEQRNLPSEYTQLEYLEVATEGAYFLTGINATVDTDMGITASNITTASAQLLVAQCTSGGDYFRVAKATATQRVIANFGPSSITDTNTNGVNKFTARVNKSGFYVDGNLVGTFSNIPSSFTGIGEVDIFRGKYSATSYYAYIGARFHNTWVDDNIFLPCRRNSDNQLGIYNIKTGEFILPSGTGTFVAGPVTVPSPSSPQTIHSITGNNTIKIEGKNLFDKSDAILGKVLRANDVIENSATAWYKPSYIEVNPSTQYVGLNCDWASVLFYDSNKNYLSITTLRTNTPQFITPSNCYYVRVAGSQSLSLSEGHYLQIEKGTTATDYVPYVEPQTAPLYLSSIQCIKEQGLSTPKTNSNFWYGTTNEFTPLTDGWGKYEFDNTQISAGKNINTMIKLAGVNLLPNKQYTIIVELRNVNTQNNSTLYLCQGRTDEAFSTSKSISINSSTPLITKYKDNTKASFENVSLGFRVFNNIPAGAYCSFEARFSIVEGDYTNTNYTYKKYWNPLEYCKIGNYSDEFYLATSSDTSLEEGKWYLKKNIGKVVLDGSENWGTNAGWNYTNTNGFIYVLGTTNTNLLSNYFVKSNAAHSSDTNGLMGIVWGNQILLRIDNTLASDTNAFKTWLSTHNTIVYYVLSSPTYTLLDDTLQTQLTNIYNNALSYEGQTNISQVNADLPFVITANGIKAYENI